MATQLRVTFAPSFRSGGVVMFIILGKSGIAEKKFQVKKEKERG